MTEDGQNALYPSFTWSINGPLVSLLQQTYKVTLHFDLKYLKIILYLNLQYQQTVISFFTSRIEYFNLPQLNFYLVLSTFLVQWLTWET